MRQRTLLRSVSFLALLVVPLSGCGETKETKVVPVTSPTSTPAPQSRDAVTQPARNIATH